MHLLDLDYIEAITLEQVAADEKARLARVEAESKARRKADGQLYRTIDLVFKEIDKAPWLTLMTNMIALRRDGELRGGVKDYFLKVIAQCPHKDVRFRIEKEFGIEQPKAHPGGPSPLRGRIGGLIEGPISSTVKAQKSSLAEIKKRRDANRAARLALQPKKGASGSKSEPGSGKKAKGGKKK